MCFTIFTMLLSRFKNLKILSYLSFLAKNLNLQAKYKNCYFDFSSPLTPPAGQYKIIKKFLKNCFYSISTFESELLGLLRLLCDGNFTERSATQALPKNFINKDKS